MATSLSQIVLCPDYQQQQLLLQHSELLKAARYELQRADIAHRNTFGRPYSLKDLFMLLKQIVLYNPIYNSLYSKSIHYVARELGGHKVSFLPATSDIVSYPIQIPVPYITLTHGCFTTKKYGSIPMTGLLNSNIKIADAFIYRSAGMWVLSLLTD